MKQYSFTVMISAALLAFSCIGNAVATENPSSVGGGPSIPQGISTTQTPVLRIAKTVSLKEAFDIRLDSNASTGYAWAIDSGEGLARLKIAGDSYETSGSAIGAPGTQIFHFVAAAPGQSRIVFIYVRPWQPNEPAQSAEAIITIE